MENTDEYRRVMFASFEPSEETGHVNQVYEASKRFYRQSLDHVIPNHLVLPRDYHDSVNLLLEGIRRINPYSAVIVEVAGIARPATKNPGIYKSGVGDVVVSIGGERFTLESEKDTIADAIRSTPTKFNLEEIVRNKSELGTEIILGGEPFYHTTVNNALLANTIFLEGRDSVRVGVEFGSGEPSSGSILTYTILDYVRKHGLDLKLAFARIFPEGGDSDLDEEAEFPRVRDALEVLLRGMAHT